MESAAPAIEGEIVHETAYQRPQYKTKGLFLYHGAITAVILLSAVFLRPQKHGEKVCVWCKGGAVLYMWCVHGSSVLYGPSAPLASG